MQLSPEQQRFVYRVAGAVLDGARVLAHKDQDAFWAPPGGSCEFGEDSMSTLVHDFREELSAVRRCQSGPLDLGGRKLGSSGEFVGRR